MATSLQDYVVQFLANKPACTECGRPATMTVDFDVLGAPDSTPVCSQECAESAMSKITRDLREIGAITAFGYNGSGRERA